MKPRKAFSVELLDAIPRNDCCCNTTHWRRPTSYLTTRFFFAVSDRVMHKCIRNWHHMMLRGYWWRHVCSCDKDFDIQMITTCICLIRYCVWTMIHCWRLKHSISFTKAWRFAKRMAWKSAKLIVFYCCCQRQKKIEFNCIVGCWIKSVH